MNAGKIALAVIGVVMALVALALIAGGAGFLTAYGTQRTADGFFTSPSSEFSTEAYALTSTEIDLGSRPGDWFPSGRLATVRIGVDPLSTTPVFVGIGPDLQVEAFLAGVARSEVTSVGPNPSDVIYRNIRGVAPSALPSEQTF